MTATNSILHPTTIKFAHGSIYAFKQAGLIGLTFGVLFVDFLTGPFFLAGFNLTGGLMVAILFWMIAFVVNGAPSLFLEPSMRFKFISSERIDKVVWLGLVSLMLVDTAFDIGFVSQQMTPGLSDRKFLPPSEQRDGAFYVTTFAVLLISMTPELLILRLYQRTFKDPNYHTNLNGGLYDGGGDFDDFPASDHNSGIVTGDPLVGDR